MSIHDDNDDIRSANLTKISIGNILAEGRTTGEYDGLANALSNFADCVWPSDARAYADELLRQNGLPAAAAAIITTFRDSLPEATRDAAVDSRVIPLRKGQDRAPE